MSGHMATRRRMLAAKGRPMILSRPHPANKGNPPPAVTVQGFLYPYAPEKLVQPYVQGDANVSILADEVTTAWPSAPGRSDWIQIDGVTWQVMGAQPVYEGPTLIGFDLWVRGGKP